MTIAGPDSLDSQTYVPETGPSSFAAHGAFTVTTTPRTHALCGDVALSATLDGAPVDGDPLSYDPASRVFTASSDDVSLVDTQGTYGVLAQLEDWPVASHATAASKEATGTISFGDACDAPLAFASAT